MKIKKLSYKVKGEKKKRSKQVRVPNDAKKVECNKKPSTSKGKYGVKVRYKYDKEKREKIVPVPKGSSNVTIR